MEDPNSLKILIAEDDEDIRHLIGAFLTARGHQVTGAADGMEALERFEAETPDMVLLDIRMPGLDGWQVLQAIRERQETVPVLILTALGTKPYPAQFWYFSFFRLPYRVTTTFWYKPPKNVHLWICAGRAS